MKEYTFEIPLTFTMKINPDVSDEEFWQIANKRLDMILKLGIFDLDENRFEVVKVRGNDSELEQAVREERKNIIPYSEYFGDLK